MELQSVIDAWLQAPDFATGRELYRRYGSSETFKRLFARREDQGAFNVLIEQIRELSRDLPTGPAAIPPPADPILKSLLPDAPDDVKALVNRRKAMWADVVALRKFIRTSEDQQQRADAAFRVLELRNEINDIWYLTEVYDRTGELPEPPPKEQQPPTELAQLDEATLLRVYNNNIKYLSKYRTRKRSESVEDEYQRRLQAQPVIELELKSRQYAAARSIQF